MNVNASNRLKELEKENRHLKRSYIKSSLEDKNQHCSSGQWVGIDFIASGKPSTENHIELAHLRLGKLVSWIVEQTFGWTEYTVSSSIRHALKLQQSDLGNTS